METTPSFSGGEKPNVGDAAPLPGAHLDERSMLTGALHAVVSPVSEDGRKSSPINADGR